MAHPLWPLYDLRITTPRLELRLATDGDVAELVELARGGLHPPDRIPFLFDFCHLESPRYESQFIQHHWGLRAAWQVDDWNLSLAVVRDRDDVVMGNQNLIGRSFLQLREVSSGSWLGAEHRGQGYGKEMRAAVLHFAFDTLGAQAASSGARVGNDASLGVSRALGYRDNGTRRISFGGQVDTEIRLRVEADQWAAVADRPPVEVTGFDGCRHLFGLD